MTSDSDVGWVRWARNAYRDWVRVDTLALAGMWIRTIGRTAPFLDPCETPHPTVDLRGVDVDVQIAPLVEGLWDLGIDTVNSCQGDARITRALWKTMPNLSGTPMAASVTVTTVSHAQVVHAALRAAAPGTGHRGLPCVWWVDDRALHVQFDPDTLTGDGVTARVLDEVQARQDCAAEPG